MTEAGDQVAGLQPQSTSGESDQLYSVYVYLLYMRRLMLLKTRNSELLKIISK